MTNEDFARLMQYQMDRQNKKRARNLKAVQQQLRRERYLDMLGAQVIVPYTIRVGSEDTK